MADANFKVTPQILRAKMDETMSRITDVKNKIAQFEGIVQRSSSCWSGEAGDRYRQSFLEFKPEIEEIIEVWRTHVADLGTIAGIYEQAETTNETNSGVLPIDVIS